MALIYISEKLNGFDVCIVRTRHDEIIVEIRDDIADQVQAIVVESMEEALERIIQEVPFVVEPKIADSSKGPDLKHYHSCPSEGSCSNSP